MIKPVYRHICSASRIWCGFSAQLRTCVYSISTNIRVCEPLNITTNIAGNQTHQAQISSTVLPLLALKCTTTVGTDVCACNAYNIW